MALCDSCAALQGFLIVIVQISHSRQIAKCFTAGRGGTEYHFHTRSKPSFLYSYSKTKNMAGMNFIRRIERSKWNCLRSGFLALGRASQLKVHLRTKREREQKQTYICFLKVSVPTSLAKIKTYYIPNLFKNRQRWLPFPRWFVSLA